LFKEKVEYYTKKECGKREALYITGLSFMCVQGTGGAL